MPNEVSGASSSWIGVLRTRQSGGSTTKWPVHKATWFAVASSLLLWTVLIAVAAALT